MELYCIDLTRICKIEIGELIRRFQLPFMTDDLFLMKMDGFNKLYYDVETHQLIFFTLNCSKKVYEPSQQIRQKLADIVPLGFQKPTERNSAPQSKHHPPTLPSNRNTTIVKNKQFNTPSEIENELNRILDLISAKGVASLTQDEKEFLKNNSNQF